MLPVKVAVVPDWHDLLHDRSGQAQGADNHTQYISCIHYTPAQSWCLVRKGQVSGAELHDDDKQEDIEDAVCQGGKCAEVRVDTGTRARACTRGDEKICKIESGIAV